MKRRWKILLVGLIILGIGIALNYEDIKRFLSTSTPEPETEIEPPQEAVSGKIAFLHGSWAIYTMNADGSNQSKLISNSDYSFHHFTFSPNGKKIAFVSTGLSGWKEDIYVINIDGSGLMQLTTNPERDTHPAWSPDGTKIAFQSNREGGFAIYIMNADGSNQTKLSKYDGTSPAWSPDGKKIAFSASDERYGISGFSRVILVMDADGSNVIVITHGLDDENPAWSPDGTKIAFQSVYSYQNGYAWEICVVNADGSGLVKLTTEDPMHPYNWTETETGISIPGHRHPSWSPDGKKIVFDLALNNDIEIYIMNADGSNRVKLTDSEGKNWHPIWLPNPKV